MCIIAEDVKVATKDITVWKVFMDGRTPFKDNHGSDVCQELKDGVTRKKVVGKKAKGFGLGFGYSVFSLKRTANCYINCIKSRHGWDNLEPVKLLIPTGTKYARGAIELAMIGGNLPAIRCERLKEAK